MSGASADQGKARRIAFVSSHAQLGGSELVLERIVDGLGGEWAPEVIALSSGPFVEGLRSRGRSVAVVGSAGRRGVVAAVLRLRAHLRRSRPDVIHANGVKAALLSVLARFPAAIPIVWMKHDFSWDGWPARAIGARCDRVIGVSEAVLETFGHGARTQVISPGVALPPIDGARSRQLVLAAMDADPDAEILTVVGRLDPIKGQMEAIEAMPEILRRRPTARLMIVGGPDDSHPELPRLLAHRVQALGLGAVVRLLGHRADALELIAGSDVVLVPTIQEPGGRGREGFGLVAGEAMALGTPVVAYEGGALADTLSGAGLLVRAGDHGALAEAAAEVLGDVVLATRLTRRGAEAARDRFSVERMVGALAAVYAAVAGEATSGPGRRGASRRRRAGERGS